MPGHRLRPHVSDDRLFQPRFNNTLAQAEGILQVTERVGIHQANDRDLPQQLHVAQDRCRPVDEVTSISHIRDGAETAPVRTAIGRGDEPTFPPTPLITYWSLWAATKS